MSRFKNGPIVALAGKRQIRFLEHQTLSKNSIAHLVVQKKKTFLNRQQSGKQQSTCTLHERCNNHRLGLPANCR